MQCVATTAAKKNQRWQTKERQSTHSWKSLLASVKVSLDSIKKKMGWHSSLQEAATEKAQSPFVFNCNFGTFKKQLETILKV